MSTIKRYGGLFITMIVAGDCINKCINVYRYLSEEEKDFIQLSVTAVRAIGHARE